MLKEYESYVMEYMNDVIAKFGGVRETARAYGVDPAVICKMRNGKYVPSPKTFSKITGKEITTKTIIYVEETV